MIKRRCTVISAGGDSNMCDVDDENHNEMASQNLNNAAAQHTTLIVGLLQDFTFEFYKPTTYRTRGEHANHYTTDAVNLMYALNG
jgi:hypothetical protein